MLASIWFVIDTSPCRITSSVIGSTVREVWATSCMRALPLFLTVRRYVKRIPSDKACSALEERERLVGGVQRPRAAAEEQRQEGALPGHLMTGAVKPIERHRAAASAVHPFDPCDLHARAYR